MKNFTHPNKWVMTGALLVALGFNVPFKSQPTPEQSADFASTLQEGVVHGKIYTPKGVVPVKYIDNGEDQVLAIIPKKMTEGQICDNCGYESISLNVKNKNDIDALNVALLQAIQKDQATALPQRSEVAGSRIDSNIQNEIKDPFETILKACARYKERAQKLDCLSDRYIKLLSRKDSNISAEDAMSFYQRHLESGIRGELTDARRLINKMRRASMDMSQWQSWQDSDDMLKDPSEMREETLKIIRTLISGLPSQYENVRKRLVNAEVMFATEDAKELEQTFKQARDSKNPSESVYLFKEGELRRQDLQGLLQDMAYHTSAGLSKASSSDFINRDLQAQYEKFFSDFAVRVQNGMWTNPYDFMGGSVSPLPTVPNLDQRQRNPGRGTTTGGMQTGPVLSNRTSLDQPGVMTGPVLSNRTGINQPGVITGPNIVPQTSFSGSSTAPMIQGQGVDMQLNSDTYTNNGVSFGTVGPASAESLRERATIRGRQ
ncbi:hypothetical protein BDW_12355 [Bdellovibrio bacteriovorus W]|nr:hypothetical protein BDW_12355 [Bdellovibrio bacteriovorus W]